MKVFGKIFEEIQMREALKRKKKLGGGGGSENDFHASTSQLEFAQRESLKIDFLCTLLIAILH